MTARSPSISAHGTRATSGCQLRFSFGFRLSHQIPISARLTSQIAIRLRPFNTAKVRYPNANTHPSQLTGKSNHNAAAAQIVTRLHNTIAARFIESIYRAAHARLLAITGGLRVTSFQFGLFCLLSFAVPVPILAWLDRSRNGKKT